MKCYPWIDMHCDSLLRAYRDGSGSLWDEEGRLYFSRTGLSTVRCEGRGRQDAFQSYFKVSVHNRTVR